MVVDVNILNMVKDDQLGSYEFAILCDDYQ